MKKIIVNLLLFSLLFTSLSAFEWPTLEVTKKSFNSYYGQKRGNLISSSIVFSEAAEVETVEEGRTLVIFENEDYFFPSTLGTSVIVSHADALVSVYGNLDNQNFNEKDFYQQGEFIGSTGNTAWQEKENALEFQILDLKNSSAINPMVLMPRSYDEPPVTISGLKLRNKNGIFFDATEVKYLASGVYKIYAKRNEIAVPFKTNILINGVLEDAISFDSISQENNKIFVSGKKKYSSEDVYPNNNLILLGEVTLTPGKSAIVVSINNVKEVVKTNTYNITIY